MRVPVILLLSFVSSISFGQRSAKQAFIDVNNTFKGIENMSYTINYSYFLDAKDKKPYETMQGIYKKSGSNYYSKIASREIIVNTKYRLVIENETQHFIIEDKPKKNAEEQFGIDIDTALSLANKITSESKNGFTTYKMFFDKVIGYNQINITVNNKTNLINKLEVFLNNNKGGNPKLTITITNYNTQPVFSEGQFSEKKYVRIDDKGNVRLNKKYSSFILLNNKVSNQ